MKLEQTLFGLEFQNPVLLAAGTCGFGMELQDVLDLEALGGFVTKSVTLESRAGNPAPRVAELSGAMVNSIGLANPGLAEVRATKIPWLRRNVKAARVLVSLAGHRADEYLSLVEALDQDDGFDGFELNLSCPNDSRLGGRPFSLDLDALTQVVSEVRRRTQRPFLVKLAPNDPDIGQTAARAEECGADGVTMINTLPGLVIDPTTGQASLGAGSGGLSGPAVRAVGVYSVWKARSRVGVPIVGVGGISTASDALQYLMAGASLVQVGTASFADPGAAQRIVAGIESFGQRRGMATLKEVIGRADLPSPPMPPRPLTAGESPERTETTAWQR
jgi:dihydroorotate dehydrogenase (NAD+) catalytic subunit